MARAGCGRLPLDERTAILDAAGVSPSPVFRVTCPRCDGYDAGAVCDLCDGSGLAPVYTCAPSEARGVEAFMRSYSALIAHGVLPETGGLNDQTAAFVSALRVADGERGIVEREMLKPRSAPPIVLGADGRPIRSSMAQRVEEAPASPDRPVGPPHLEAAIPRRRRG